MKKVNRHFRRDMLEAERQEKEDIKRYPLNDKGSAGNENGEGVTIYSDARTLIMCSDNLLDPEEMKSLRGF